MGVLSNYEPKDVFGFFEEICSIPHGSGHTDQIAEYLVNFGKKRGLETYRDKANNVIIRKPASAGYENADTLILQGHHDMVCEKTEDSMIDFLKDGITPYVDGDYIRAKGTSLGGDNGIAVAMMLAILNDDTLAHPALEMLITADEEIGMLGAFALDCSQLKGHKLINLDSEYEGILMCSCAGGANARNAVPVEREAAQGTLLSVELKGMKSGHSGVEIDKGRANSNVLAGRVLADLAGKIPCRVVELAGGSRETAIANATKMKVLVDAGDADRAVAALTELASALRKEYQSAEPDMVIDIVNAGSCSCDAVTVDCTKRIANLLNILPDGVQAMCVDMPGLVQTSSNLGLLKLEKDVLTFSNTVRSSMTTQKNWILSKVASAVALAGGTSKVDGNYPGWAFNKNSVVADTIIHAYKELFGKDAKVDAVHAGIECGLFADAIDNLDCVSIGPEMADVHTPNEHLSISSSARTYELLKLVLKNSR